MDNNNMYNQNQSMNNGNYTQQPYQQPYQAAGNGGEDPVTVGEWMISMLVMIIPCVNIIMMFVWAFGKGKKSKSNYFKASLIWVAIAIVIYIVLFVTMGAQMMSLFGVY